MELGLCPLPALDRTGRLGRPLGFFLTGGEASDYLGVEPLKALPVDKPPMLLADKGYDGNVVRQNLLLHGILPVIPPRSNRAETILCDFRLYRDRNRIERIFNRLKPFHRIATRYDKTARASSQLTESKEILKGTEI